MTRYKILSSVAFVIIATIASTTSSRTVFADERFRAINVNTIIPPKTFTGVLETVPSSADPMQIVGPGNGIFGITNISLTNTDSNPQFVGLGVPSSCANSGAISGTIASQLFYYVQPHSTLVVPFPTPFVTNSTGGGQSCIAAVIFSGITFGASVILMVTGVVN